MPNGTAARERLAERRRRRYAQRVNRLIRDELRQERRNVRNSLRIVRDMRTRIIEELKSAGPIDAAHQEDVLKSIDRAVAEMEGRIGNLMDGANEDSFNRGSDIGRRPLESALDLELGAPDISPDVLTAVQANTGELISDLGKNVKKELAAEVNRAVLGEIRVDDAINNIDKKLRSGKVKLRGKRARVGVAWQAERIVRTETARTFSIANRKSTEAAKKVLPDLMKQWFTNLDGRERPSHRRIHLEIRPMGRRFSNGLMQPLDPSGPPDEVVNCRCVLLTIRPDWGAPTPLERAAGVTT
jgi:hypothetical protein